MEQDHAGEASSLFEGMDFVLSGAPEQDLDAEKELSSTHIDDPPETSPGEDLFTGMSMLSNPELGNPVEPKISKPPSMARTSFDSIMAAYDSVGLAPSAGRKASASASAATMVKGGSGGRKKKKNLRIGYGRDNDDGDDLREGILNDQVETKGLEISVESNGASRISVSASEVSQETEVDIDEKDLVKEAAEILVDSEEVVEEETTTLHAREEIVVSNATVEEPAQVKDADDGAQDTDIDGAQDTDVDGASVGVDHADSPVSCVKEITTEEKLQAIKEKIEKRLEDLETKAGEVSVARKMASQVRRKAGEELSAAATRRKALELELENACEKEDFDLADKLSQEIADAEKSVEVADASFKEAEAKYDLAAVAMEDIVSLRIKIEEEGAADLAMLQEEAEAAAENLKMQAAEVASLDTEKLLAKEEELDIKSTQYLLELRGLEEAKTELDKTIAEAIQPDVRTKNDLLGERQVLVEELEDLLRLVKEKELEISKRDHLIQETDMKIAGVTVTFEDKKIQLETDLTRVTCLLEELDSDSGRLQLTRKGVEDGLTLADLNAEGLKHIAGCAAAEAQQLRDALEMRRKVAELARDIKEKKAELVKREEQLIADSQALRQQSSEARASLQELSSNKMRLQEDIRTAKEKIAHHEKRGPALEAEKRLAAATRNFKEAARLSAEAKAFRAEKEAVTEELQKSCSDLHQVGESIEAKIVALADIEGMIAIKEREAAQACCERLRLAAAAARNERKVAIELDDLEEADSLQAEAAAADAEADELQRIHQFQGDEFRKLTKAEGDGVVEN